MADRVAASIVIGGALPSSPLDAFVALVECEELTPEWDGEPFTVEDLPVDGPLRLMANEVAWGELSELEDFCLEYRLPFARWRQSSSGSWGASRAVFTGTGAVQTFATTDDDTAMIDRETVARLGSVEAILAFFDTADLIPPPLHIVRG